MDTPSQSELVSRLVAIFPSFAAAWEADTAESVFPSDRLHSVYQSFLPFVSIAPATSKQLASLATLLNCEVAAGGDRENPVGTCFLEHCGQVGLIRKLRPLLTAETRNRLHA